MRDIFTTRIIIALVVIVVVWAGIGILIYYQTQPGVPATIYTTNTSTITTSTVTTPTTTTTASPFTESEQEYIDFIIDHSSQLIDSVTTLSTLLTNMQLEDASWVSQVGTQTAALIALDAELEGVSTPYSMVNIHYNYVYANSAYKSAAQSIDYGITTQGTDSIQQGVSMMNSGADLFNNSINMLNEFIASHQ